MSVKAIFPSISITKKKSKSAGSPQAPQFRPFLRPLTPESRRKQAVSNSNEALRAFPPRSSPISASPLSLRPNSSETNLTSLDDGGQLSRSTPDLRFGFRQFRSVSQPIRPTNSLRDHESFSSVTLPQDRSHSLNNDSSYFIDVVEAPMIEQEDIIALTHHVRTFSEALSSLRNTFMECEENPEGGPPEVKAHERLGEVLSVLKGVLNKYQPLNSTDILASAGTLINKVKSHNYEDDSKVPDEFYESIDQLALAFSSSVSDFLMGEQDMALTEADGHSRSLEAYNDDDLEDSMGMVEVDEQGYEEGSEDEHDDIDDKDEQTGSEKRESVDTSAEKANELDKALIQLEHGIDIAMQRTKIWTKYSKDIAAYVDRRAHLELDYTNKLTKLAQATKAAVTEESYLPFQSIFVTALDQDIDYAENANKTYSALLQNRFMEPLTGRRYNHDRTRKELKDTWTKASKKLNESLVNLEKAKKLYVQKQQELEKSKPSETAGKDELLSSATLSAFARGTKKKEGDIRKADEAEEIYKQCVAEANARQKELEATKAHILVELRQLIYQCDMTMKAVTCNYFQMMSELASPAPVQYQTLADSSRVYEPGSQFAEFVHLQQANSTPAIERVYQFEPFTMGGCSDRSQHTPSRHNSLFELHSQSVQTPVEETVRMSPFSTRRIKSLQLNSTQALSSTQQPIKAWNSKDNNSDNDSITSRSLPGSPTHSPSTTRKNTHLPRARSLELISSDDGAKERNDKGDMAKRNGPDIAGSTRKRPTKPRSSAGPFQSSRLSLAAQTHTLKKLRSASRCRCCDSYVYFNGAECEVCGMTCHKKCLGRLKVKCGTHQRSGRRMTTFGVDINQHIQDSSTKEENVPFILSSCINEIDRRGLDVKGIYRVSGVKSKVEVLCQSFESGQDYADLTDIPPHVIAAVLKLYIRQLPEPLLTFKLYPDFIRIARESFAFISNAMTCKQASEDKDLREEYDKLLGKLREVIMRLPKTNRLTTARLIKHLKKVSEHEQANAMPGSNLAIVFGPTLLRPCDTTSTLSSLVDMPHQSRLVELLITNPEVFELPEDVEPDTPVEEFTPPNPRDRQGSVFAVQSLRSSGNDPDESYEAEDEASFINTPDTHRSLPVTELSSDVQKSSFPISISGPRSPNNFAMSPPKSSRSSLGFGSDFFDLLAKSNSRTDMQPDQSVPEFLLPDSLCAQPAPLGEDSDLEDEYEDDTTQGTSGSRTPDDELETSHFGGSKRASAASLSYENLTEDKLSSPAESSPSLPEPPQISPSSSLYSFAPSFSSDFPDTDSLLPDLSDCIGSGKFNSPKSMALSNISAGPFDPRDPRLHSFSGTTERLPRPRHLVLVKRNSDLPGRVQRVDEFSSEFYPIGIKPSISDPDLNKDPYIIEEEPQFQMVSETVSSLNNVERFEADEVLFVEKDDVCDPGYKLRFPQDECPIEFDLGGSEVCHLEIGQDENSPVQCPLTEETTESPPSLEKELPHALKKAKEFATSDEHVSTEEQSAVDASHELIIPVMTALQERRPSTPNCSTVQASAGAVGGSTERTRNEVEEKRQEAKARPRLTYTRVSVKDRLQQYEKGGLGSFDSSRKTLEWASVNTVASRKEMFETREKSSDRVLYKRISDMGRRKPGSDSGSGSGSASGSPKLQRHRLQNVEDGTQKKVGESNFHTSLLKSQSIDEPRCCQPKEKSENSERSQSLILYKVHVDRTELGKSERTPSLESLKPGVFEREKGTLTPREIDIPLDSEVGERSDRPRKSPNTSPRSSRLNVRSPFPGDSSGEEREPQFV